MARSKSAQHCLQDWYIQWQSFWLLTMMDGKFLHDFHHHSRQLELIASWKRESFFLSGTPGEKGGCRLLMENKKKSGNSFSKCCPKCCIVFDFWLQWYKWCGIQFNYLNPSFHDLEIASLQWLNICAPSSTAMNSTSTVLTVADERLWYQIFSCLWDGNQLIV